MDEKQENFESASGILGSSTESNDAEMVSVVTNVDGSDVVCKDQRATAKSFVAHRPYLPLRIVNQPILKMPSRQAISSSMLSLSSSCPMRVEVEDCGDVPTRDKCTGSCHGSYARRTLPRAHSLQRTISVSAIAPEVLLPSSWSCPKSIALPDSCGPFL